MSAEKQVTEAAKTGRKRRQVVLAGTSSHACQHMTRYLERLLTDVDENWC